MRRRDLELDPFHPHARNPCWTPWWKRMLALIFRGVKPDDGWPESFIVHRKISHMDRGKVRGSMKGSKVESLRNRLTSIDLSMKRRRCVHVSCLLCLFLSAGSSAGRRQYLASRARCQRPFNFGVNSPIQQGKRAVALLQSQEALRAKAEAHGNAGSGSCWHSSHRHSRRRHFLRSKGCPGGGAALAANPAGA